MGIPLLPLVLSTLMASIFFTWVYNSTGGSLLMVWILHAATTVPQYFLAPLPTFTDGMLSWIVAGLVVIIAGPENLSRKRITAW